jgi:hypothetical protein
MISCTASMCSVYESDRCCTSCPTYQTCTARCTAFKDVNICPLKEVKNDSIKTE